MVNAKKPEDGKGEELVVRVRQPGISRRISSLPKPQLMAPG